MNARIRILPLTLIAAGLAGAGCHTDGDAAPAGFTASLVDAVIEGELGGTVDAGPEDAGAPPSDFSYGQLDTPGEDAPGLPDAGGYDAGGTDAGPEDAGAPPADFSYGQLDTSVEDDAGTPDAGSLPDSPAPDVPPIDAPDVPDLDAPDVPDLDAPDVPDLDAPDDDEETDDGFEETGDDGCTPGFWKNHPEAWAATGYSPYHAITSVFVNAAGIGSAADASLADALAFGGGRGLEGAARILLRAAVAALLNASHPGVDYPLTSAGIIAAVDAALTGDRDAMLALAGRLDAFNNLGCPDAKRLD